MSRFNHATCVACWNNNNPTQPTDPRRDYTRGREEVCCWCSRLTCSGIYVRVDPANVPCHGNHSEDL
jgi:hypothetical protein